MLTIVSVIMAITALCSVHTCSDHIVTFMKMFYLIMKDGIECIKRLGPFYVAYTQNCAILFFI